MRAVLEILAKDLRLRIRDRSAFIVGFGAPLVLASILNLIIGGSFGQDEFSATIAVVDQDGGRVASELVKNFNQPDSTIKIRDDLTEAEARAKVDDDALDAAIVIPEGTLVSRFVGDTPQALRVIGNVNQQVATAIARGIADNIAVRLDAARIAAEVADIDPGDDPEAIGALMGQSPPVSVADLPASARQLDGTTYIFAGLGVFFLFFLVQYGVIGLLEERQNGTLARLLAAPIPQLVIPLAKALTSVVMGLIGLGLIVVVSTLLMGAKWGDPWAVAA